jgi:PAS domain S-box-containing protein
VRSLAIVAHLAAALLVVIGAGVLLGWAADVWWLKDPLGGFTHMAPNTALMLILSGLSLELLCSPATSSRPRLWAARSLAAACGVMALATLAEDLLGCDLGIDALLFEARPARPAVPTSVALAFSSAALLSLDVRPRRGPTPAELLAAGTATIGALTLGGLLYGAIQFHLFSRHPPAVVMAIHTSATLLVLALGLLAARPVSGAMAIVTSPLVGGQVIRRMLPLLFCIPVLGYLAARAQDAGLYPPPGAAVVEAVASVIVATLIMLVVGHSLNGADARRRRTEQENREWKRFFDLATFGAVFGTGDGRLGWINPAFARMHGRTVAELVGRPIAEVFPPHRRAELAEKIGVANEHGHCRWESEHLRKDGSVFPVVIDLSSIRDERGETLYRAAYIQDITDEKAADAVRARLASLVQSADDAIVAKALDGTVLDWNHGAERIYGYAAAEVVGRSILAIVPDDRRAEREALRARVLAGEIVVGFETVRARKDGTLIQIALTLSPIRDPGGNIVGISTIARDISLRKQIEADLRRARERESAHRIWLETVIEHTPEAIVIVDEHGDVIRQNAAASSLAGGIGTLALSGRPLPHDVRSPSGARLAGDDLPAHRALLHGETTNARELAVVASSGELVPVLASAAPVDIGGERRGAVTIFRDMRALKQLERERTEWSSVVAHDLRQPAAVIRLAAESLARMEGPAVQKAVERIRRASESLERMIEDLLDVSQIDARRLTVRPVHVSVPALITEAMEVLPGVASRCRTEVEPGATCAWADAGRCVQVLSNLLSNAHKYGDPGTPIEVRAEPFEGMVKISVTNEGPGIAPDEIPELFSRFSRTRSARSGTAPGLGLGLYICRGLVEALGGKLWVESVPGGKTHFQFTLPPAEAREQRLAG